MGFANKITPGFSEGILRTEYESGFMSRCAREKETHYGSL